MAKPRLLQSQWARMVQDLPRYKLPPDAVWNMEDWIPDLDEKRGGWKDVSPDLSTVAANASFVSNVAYAVDSTTRTGSITYNANSTEGLISGAVAA